MYLSDSASTVARRWYLVLPIVLLTVFGAGFTFMHSPPSYTGDASLVFLAPLSPVTTNSQTTKQINPYMDFDGSLYATADVVARTVTSDQTVKWLSSRGDSTVVSAGMTPGSPAPIIDLAVKGTSREQVKRTLADIITAAGNELQKRQSNEIRASGQWIRTSVLDQTINPKVVIKSKLKKAVSVAAVGFVIAYVAAFVADGYAARRRRRRIELPAAVELASSEDLVAMAVGGGGGRS